MAYVPGLRSPYAKVGRLVYFGRMLDKIRLHADGRLPPAYVANLGTTRPTLFDARCCRFLGVEFAALSERVQQGGTDEEVLAWAEKHGTPHNDEDCMIWNRFMTKLGWRDDRVGVLQQRIVENNLVGKPIETMFDMLEFDEGRNPIATRPWETV
jgi:hypothetical protein